MSRVKDETQYKPNNGTPAKAGPKQTNYYVFRPTKAEREEITTKWTDMARNLAKITDMLESGAKLNLGYAKATNSYFCSLRGEAANWTDAPTVTVFHNNPERLLAMLAYFLEMVSPEFPRDLPRSYRPDELEW